LIYKNVLLIKKIEKKEVVGGGGGIHSIIDSD
jgi:hypothetical protein